MKIFASAIQRALYDAIAYLPKQTFETGEETTWKQCLSALERGEQIEIDYSSRYDESGSLVSRPVPDDPDLHRRLVDWELAHPGAVGIQGP